MAAPRGTPEKTRTSGAPVPAPTPSLRVTQQEQEWEAQNDLETLTRAHQIKSDPKRHARAQAHAKQKLTSIKAAAGC